MLKAMRAVRFAILILGRRHDAADVIATAVAAPPSSTMNSRRLN
jgi:hypothetical protein